MALKKRGLEKIVHKEGKTVFCFPNVEVLTPGQTMRIIKLFKLECEEIVSRRGNHLLY